MESAILTPKRTEYGKKIRKAYESGEIKESRHNMTELEPRTDGVCNTITTVQKDNLLLEAVKKIPCQLDKSDFQTLDEAGIKNVNTDVAGTISARYYKGIGGNGDNMVIEVSEKRLGNINGYTGGSFNGMVYDKDGLCPTLNTMNGGNRQPMIVEDRIIVAQRGRNPQNPSDRTAGIPTEQRLEPNSQGICNTITTVGKDNMVLEKAVQLGYIDHGTGQHQSNTVYDTNALSPTITTIKDGGTQRIKILEECKQYKIRKLTPLETWRLQGFSDSDFHKAAAVNSNSQLYKESGNSICEAVLCALFSQLNIKGVKPWNEMSQEERGSI